MDAIRLERSADGGRLDVQTVPDPRPGPGDVCVRVGAAGVCGSDVGAYRGKSSYDFVETPRILGHEYVGVVESVGDGVSAFEVGDVVVERPLRSCGTCTHCRGGRTQVCESVRITGFHHDGAFAARTVVPEAYLHSVPADVPRTRAALVEPLAVTSRAVVEVGSVAPGDAVLVEGPGPMGAFSALVARRAGADVVVSGLERDASRLARLEAVGVDTVDVTSRDPAAKAPEAGFDVVVDATGVPAGASDGVGGVRNGGRVVLLGIPAGDVTVAGPDLVRGEISLRASYGATSADFERAIRLLDSPVGESLEELTDVYSPSSPAAAFEAFGAAETVKPVFEMAAFE